MPTFTVRIVARGNVECTVVPAHVFLEVGDQIEFKAPETSAVVVLIPKNIFGEGSPQVINVAKGQKSSACTIETGTALGVYPYAVYCAEHMDFAEGNSPPAMIVE